MDTPVTSQIPTRIVTVHRPATFLTTRIKPQYDFEPVLYQRVVWDSTPCVVPCKFDGCERSRPSCRNTALFASDAGGKKCPGFDNFVFENSLTAGRAWLIMRAWLNVTN
jgi:hypothetical protein